MRWRGRRQSRNVEDRTGRGGFRLPGGFSRRRGMGGLRRPGRRGGGISIVTLLIILGGAWLFGINPLGLMGGGDMFSPAPGQGFQTPGSSVQSELKAFARTVLAETEDTWGQAFKQNNMTYREPTLVFFAGSTRSNCGFASAASGPFYCPADQKIYIDLSFYDQLKRQFQAPGDFAQAYVLAHEVGHHVQNLTGVLPKFAAWRRGRPEAQVNQMSVRVELQADCYAGIWARHTAQKGLLEEGDMAEALNAASKIGDDAMQRRAQGYVVPEAFNHGTSEQRFRWFKRGFDSGTLAACDTFSAPV